MLDEPGKTDAHRAAPLELLGQLTDGGDDSFRRGGLRSFDAGDFGGECALARIHDGGLDASAADIHTENSIGIVHVEENEWQRDAEQREPPLVGVMRAGCRRASPASSIGSSTLVMSTQGLNPFGCRVQ